MASGRGHRICLDPVSLVPLLMALPLDQPLLLLLLPLSPLLPKIKDENKNIKKINIEDSIGRQQQQQQQQQRLVQRKGHQQ